MTVFKCKMCGGALEVKEGMTVCECEYCGSTQTVPQLDDEKKINLFSRANRLRSACEFDKASGIYEAIIADFPEEAEAYWGLLLCRFGIEYVDDPRTGKKIPTCHRSSFESIMDDQDFEMVMEYSDPTSRTVYRNEAKAIEKLRIGINEVSSKEAPYDIFICYKETDAMGERTLDSVIAQDVYDALVEKGYRVFFSRITLEDKLGEEYEPYIFAALNSSKVMLVFGTDYEYFNAVWVKNEWSRFLALIEKGEKKTLIPCFKGIDAYDMPKEFARLQAQDMGKVGSLQDLLRGIEKILGTRNGSNSNAAGTVISADGSALTQRGNMALEDGAFEEAEGYFERALDANPTDACAYLGKFLAYHRVSSLDELADTIWLEDNKEYKRAEQFADPALAKQLKEVRERNELMLYRLQFVDDIKKITEKKAEIEAFQLMAQRTNNAYEQALDLYDIVLKSKCITESKCKSYKRMAESQFFVLKYLYDCLEIRSLSEISEAAREIRSMFQPASLDRLVDAGFLEKYPEGYCWPGAKEERERILREKEEKKQSEARQKAAYDDACAEVGRQIQEEIDLRISQLSEEFDPRLNGIQRKINEEIAECTRQREIMQGQISDWRTQQSSLGIFKGKEKKALQAQIDEAQRRLSTIPTQQQIQDKYQPDIDRMNTDKNTEINRITAEVRSHYIMPKLEDFA